MLELSFIALLVALAIVWALSRSWAHPYRDALSALAAIITAVTFVAASLWYFRERPFAPKLNISIAGQAVPISADQVLVLIEVNLENVGSAILRLENADAAQKARSGRPAGVLRLYVQQVTPLLGEVEKELNIVGPYGPLISPAENFGALATLHHPLDVALDAGEIETLYFRVKLPCQPDLRLYVTTKLPKQPLAIEQVFAPASAGVTDGTWIKQSLIDASQACQRRTP